MIKENFYDDIGFNIVGIDEVGRGALCGPVVSCAVQLKKTIMKQSFITEIDDSKKNRSPLFFGKTKLILPFLPIISKLANLCRRCNGCYFFKHRFFIFIKASRTL